MKKNASQSLSGRVSRERLNQLMDAMALIIARRQMRGYWPKSHHRARPCHSRSTRFARQRFVNELGLSR